MNYRFYKYMGLEYLIDVFRGCQIKLSSRCEFNDKFDCFGHGSGYLSSEAFLPKSQYDALYDSGIGGREKLMFMSLSAADGINSDLLMDYQVRILCMVKNDEKHEEHAPYFWGCYGNNGKGARIGLKFDSLKTADYEIQPVAYSDDVPQLDFSTVTHPYDENLMEFYRKRVWTKGVAWGHEQEQRLMVMTKDHGDCVVRSEQPVPDTDPRSGLKLMFLKIQPDMLESLTFGPNASDESVGPILKELFSMQNFNHLKVCKAVRRNDKYVFDYEPIERS